MNLEGRNRSYVLDQPHVVSRFLQIALLFRESERKIIMHNAFQGFEGGVKGC